MRIIAQVGLSIVLLCFAFMVTEQAKAANKCTSYIQGKIAWDYKGSKQWGKNNLVRLCQGAETSVQPGICFNRVMHGGVNWGGGTKWQWSNALNLCQGTLNAAATINCFRKEIDKKRPWSQAIKACKTKTAVKTTQQQAPVRIDPNLTRNLSKGGLFTFIGNANKTSDTTKTAEEKESGPSAEVIDIVSAMAQSSGVEEDFNNAIGWSSRLYQDNKDRATYYYLPKTYLLLRDEDPKTGYKMKFTYGNISDSENEAKVSFNALLGPSNRKGDLKLLQELLKYAVKDVNANQLKVKPFPMADTTVVFNDLRQAFDIDEKDIYMSEPQNINEPIEVVIRMKESVQAEFVTHLRNQGLSGRFLIKEKTVGAVEIPIRMEFKEYSGPVVSYFDDVSPKKPLVNLSSFPVKISGFISYSEDNKNKLRRQFHAFRSPVTIPPGGARNVPELRRLIKGKYIHAWFDTALDTSCDSCLDAVEKNVLASATNLRKTKLVLEAMPNIFTEQDVFKLIVEVESEYFDLSNTKQVRNYILKNESASIDVPLYVDADISHDSRTVRYRYKYIKSDGTGLEDFVPWRESQTLDVTITPLDIEQSKSQ